MEMKYNVGDRVRVIGGDAPASVYGCIGRVITGVESWSNSLGIEFDFTDEAFHNCGDRGEDGHCYWFEQNDVELVEESDDRVGFKNSEPAAMISEIKNGGTVDARERVLDDMALSEVERRILQNAKEINNFDAYAISDEIERRILQNANQLDKIDIHKDICDEIHSTYRVKNADYGDSFAKVREKFPNSILIRLNDKLNRLEQLYENGDQQVQDESVRDTLIDLAGYCILELLEIEIDSHKQE